MDFYLYFIPINTLYPYPDKLQVKSNLSGLCCRFSLEY